MQSLGGHRNSGSMDPDFELKRQAIRDRTYQILQQRPLTAAPEMQPRLKDIVRRLEECLFKHAASKEDYLDMDTLETRINCIISRLAPQNRGQQLPPLNFSSSSIGTMIPTPVFRSKQSKMHAQAHMSGQISGNVPNQVGNQLPGLPQHNGSLASMQSLGGHRNSGSMDPNIELKRQAIRDRIYQILQQRPLTTSPEMQSQGGHRNSGSMDPDIELKRQAIRDRFYQILQQRPLTASPLTQPRMKDIVRRLEECLFKQATSKEDYLDMDTLETRLNCIISHIPPQNRGQQLPPLNSSSSSIGTMIPTPGMQHSGNFNTTITSSVANSMIASSGTVTPNTVNAGQLLTNSSGSGGAIHGGSFNASNGPLPNGYDQSGGNVSFGSGINNMMPSGVVQRIASQMIPTPGMSIAQSSINSESSNNGGGFYGVESTMVSQLQQPKQYIGGPNNHMLHSLGGQVGMGMSTSLQQKPSPYGFSNGSLNGGLGLIGNNMPLMNGPASSDGYLTASAYGNSSKPLLQHFDPQHQQQLMPTALSQQMIPMAGDGYGMNVSFFLRVWELVCQCNFCWVYDGYPKFEPANAPMLSDPGIEE